MFALHSAAYAITLGSTDQQFSSLMWPALAVLSAFCFGIWVWHQRHQNPALDLCTLALDGAQIVISDADGKILLWSRGCERFYGWSEDEALGRNKYELLRSRCEQPGLAGLPQTTGVNELELIQRRRDGSEISVLECSYAIERIGRDPLTASKMIDISRRVASEELLRLSADRLRSMFEATPSPMVVLDDVGTIVEFSPAAERLWGFAAREVCGQPLATLALPEDYPPLAELLACQLESPERERASRCGVPAIGVTRAGEQLSLEVNSGRADTPQGALVMLFFHDVSARLRDEQRIGELNSELAHVSRQTAMSELAADLAHELNQPLSAAANFLASARIRADRGESGGHIAELLRSAEDQTHRSGEIIRNLRDFMAKRDVEMRPESIGKIVRESLALVLFGSARGARPALLLDPACDGVFVNRTQVQQVLVNLLRNAVEAQQHQPVGSRAITLASRCIAGGMTELSVRDFGPGLPEDFTERLQRRFSTSKHGASMGIGLSISRRIVEAHGGSLRAENMPGGGAIFRFTLPLEPALSPLEPQPGPTLEGAGS